MTPYRIWLDRRPLATRVAVQALMTGLVMFAVAFIFNEVLGAGIPYALVLIMALAFGAFELVDTKKHRKPLLAAWAAVAAIGVVGIGLITIASPPTGWEEGLSWLLVFGLFVGNLVYALREMRRG